MRVDDERPNNRLRRRAAAMAIASALCVASSAPMAAIIDSGFTSLQVPATAAGLYLNLVTGAVSANPAMVPGWDFNPYAVGGNLTFFASTTATNISAVVATASVA